MSPPASNPGSALNTPVDEVPRLREQVYDRIRRAILNGELVPGARLSVSALAERLGVSTMPVREAIRLLEDDGLLETSARRWTRVATVSIEEAEEVYPLIGLLEEFAILTGEPATPTRLKRLRRANAQLKAAALNRDAPACIKADEAFHSVLLESCANGTVLRSVEQHKARMRLLEGAFFREVAHRSVEQHAAIIAAMERGDLEAAGGLVRANWESGLEGVREALASDPSVD